MNHYKDKYILQNKDMKQLIIIIGKLDNSM